MYNLANASIYFYSIQRGTPHVNLRQKRASLFNSQILVVALIGIFGGLKPKMCVHFSKDWRSALIHPKFVSYTDILPLHLHSHYLKHITTISTNRLSLPNTHQQLHLLPIPTNNSIYSQYSTKLKNTPNYTPSDTLHPLSHKPPDQSSPNRHCTS